MNQDFLNLYIENLNNYLSDARKQEIMTLTQLRYTEKMNVQLSERITQLEQQLSDLNEKPKKTKKLLEEKSPDTF